MKRPLTDATLIILQHHRRLQHIGKYRQLLLIEHTEQTEMLYITIREPFTNIISEFSF